ncbi:hypothetical protein HMPREF3293_03052 [Christensenella minuta]|uniref:Uncharacterized protein n=1 Tax=Christensenella minuta TaxID=626937 RepID=A0A136Q0B8_9FIRM|nr:hypothetical protein HMPREF3293_03052 [Christensenella minuta]
MFCKHFRCRNTGRHHLTAFYTAGNILLLYRIIRRKQGENSFFF